MTVYNIFLTKHSNTDKNYEFKNFWSAKPYWFKGGILGILIQVFSYSVCSVPVLGFLCPLALFAYIVARIVVSKIFGADNKILFTGILENDMIPPTVIGSVILNLVVLSMYFFVGAFLGFIVGKYFTPPTRK